MSFEYSEDNLIEKTAIELFLKRLYWNTAVAYNIETFGEDSTLGRLDKREVILKREFIYKLREFNPGLPEKAYHSAYEKLLEESSVKSLAEINREKYNLLRDGIPVDFINNKGEQIINKFLKVYDFENPENNEFLAVRQLWIEGKSKRLRRPDIIGFVNGIPLLFIELKAAHRKLEKAFNENFTDYLDVIPKLFHTNAFVILSNGIESRIGSITAKYQHFNERKRITEEEEGKVDLDKIILGVCEKNRFMDLFENFILFDDSLGNTIKLISRNHQFLGVNKAIENIKQKDILYKKGEIDLQEKQKLGVFWHTQGSGKSYSMVFLAQKVHRKFKGSYTFLIATDRNELDTQIYGTFCGAGAVPQIKAGSKDSIKAGSGEHLKKLLSENHRYIFTLIHKFNFDKEITSRENIIVISDEAHRTQGGTLALNMRNSLPKASFMGFTGTPLFKGDELTKRIFGDYVSKYDFKRSADDGSTVPLYYENRGEYLKIKNPKINEEIRNILDETEDLESNQRGKLERLFANGYPVYTSKKRLNAIAKDVVWHFFNRGYKGKGMYISLDKLTAVKMYDLIVKHKEEYVNLKEKEFNKLDDIQEKLIQGRELKWIKETEICVVISSEQNEIKKFREAELDIEPHREKMNTRDLETEFKDENNPFRFVIVCAMWITGFDVPCLSTLYIDKPLKSHTLMQAIARANRINEGKNNGLIVDYIETYNAIINALKIYGVGSRDGGTVGGVIDPPIKLKEELISQLEKSLETTEKFLNEEVKFNIKDLINSTGLDKLSEIEKGVNSVCSNDETKRKFQILARDVFIKYNAVMPDTVLNKYSNRRNAIKEIFSAIEDYIDTSDVSSIVKKIQDIVDESIDIKDNGLIKDKGKIIDLSNLNIEVLREKFLKTNNKCIAVQILKDRVEKQLTKMVEENPLRVDFYKKYQEIIDEYNKGKDAVTVEETFKELINFVSSLSEEKARVTREGLNEEQAAVFDILRKPELTTSDKNKVKEIAIELLEELKKEKLKVDQWTEKPTTSAAVFTTVSNYLYKELPYPTYQKDDIDEKTTLLYDHFRNQYFGGGVSVYGKY
ncbi:MAG TPA: type I restriction endonuclease subunit R [Ignavibacteria bacterium]